MYFQTITNASGVRLVCSNASIQRYPLVLLPWLYINTVNLHYNTFAANVEGPENKKSPNFCKTEATQCLKKSDAPKGRVPGVRIMQGRFLNSALGPFLCVFFFFVYTSFGASLFWTLGGCCLAEIWTFFVFRTFQMCYNGIVMKVYCISVQPQH